MSLHASLLTLLIAVGASCARNTRVSEAPFAAIQRDEARLARGLAVVDSGKSCGDVQSGADTVCAARRDLCERVRESADADAQTRCLRASDQCISARTRAQAACAEHAARGGT